MSETPRGTLAPEVPIDRAARLVRESRTFAADAGIDLRDTPAPLFRDLYREADAVTDLHRELRRIPGVGAHAAHIWLREAQAVLPDVAPYLDERVLVGAKQLGLPTDPDDLAALVDPLDLPRLAAGCVRATLGSGNDTASST
jgi:hypothetical protein